MRCTTQRHADEFLCFFFVKAQNSLVASSGVLFSTALFFEFGALSFFQTVDTTNCERTSEFSGLLGGVSGDSKPNSKYSYKNESIRN